MGGLKKTKTPLRNNKWFPTSIWTQWDYLTSFRDGGTRGAWGATGKPQFLSDQITLFQPSGADYARRITAGTPNFFDIPPFLSFNYH